MRESAYKIFQQENLEKIYNLEEICNIMRHIKIVDARMGRGKSSAAIRYMNENKGKRCFLYITPYLAEVDRVSTLCDFDEPGKDCASKLSHLKSLMRKQKNIASTHALFTMMDEEALALAEENGYSLIIDEAIPVVDIVSISRQDLEIMMDSLVDEDEDGGLHWRDPAYTGLFSNYKKMADEGVLRHCSGSVFSMLNPKKFLYFDEVIMMTYLFGGQMQKVYFDYFGFTYDIVGIVKDDEGFMFSDKPDEPEPVDYSALISIIGEGRCSEWERKMNDIGKGRTALSSSWYISRGKEHEDVCTLRCNLRNFFERKTKSGTKDRLWTTFKGNESWLLGQRGRFASNFLALNTRATNEYRDTSTVAYLVNRFINPNIMKFFSSKGFKLNQDQFALAEMLQFIWRSAIRDDKPITVYIPSQRMRKLLVNWIEEMNTGKEEKAA